MSEWTLTIVPASEIKAVWPKVGAMLAPAVRQSGGRVTMPTLFAGLREKRYALWVTYHADKVIRAAFVTRVAAYPNRRMLVVDFVGGTGMREWVNDADAMFRRYARDNDCTGVELHGRVGWERVLKPSGWRRSFVVLEVGLGEGSQDV